MNSTAISACPVCSSPRIERIVVSRQQVHRNRQRLHRSQGGRGRLAGDLDVLEDIAADHDELAALPLCQGDVEAVMQATPDC